VHTVDGFSHPGYGDMIASSYLNPVVGIYPYHVTDMQFMCIPTKGYLADIPWVAQQVGVLRYNAYSHFRCEYHVYLLSNPHISLFLLEENL